MPPYQDIQSIYESGIVVLKTKSAFLANQPRRGLDSVCTQTEFPYVKKKKNDISQQGYALLLRPD
jgi:hypothetical protein